MESTSYLSNTSTEEFSDMSGKNILGVEEAGKTDGVCFGDLLVANKHEPLDASHGAQIMAKEYKQENELLKEEITILKAQCNAKDGEIAHFKEILSAKDKEIADLKEKLSELQQNRREKEADFAKQMKTTVEELKKTKDSVLQARENILKKGAEVEKLEVQLKYNEVQLCNGKDYFDDQPSWFDTLQNNIGYLEINNYPVRAKDLDTKNTGGASDKPSKPKHSMAAKAEGYQLKNQPPPVPLANFNTAEVKKVDISLSGKDSTDSRSKANPFRKAKGKVCQLQHPPQHLFVPVKAAVTPPAGQNRPFLGNDVKTKAVDSIQTTPVNPFSKAAKAEDYQLINQTPPIPVANSHARAEVKKVDIPVSGKDSADSRKTNDGSQSNKPNPFRKAKGKVCQLQLPTPPLFVPVKAAVTPPAGQNRPLLGNDVTAKAVDSMTTPVNPFSKAAKAEGYQLKDQPPPIPVANSDRPEVKKVDIPVSGKDFADSKKTDDGSSKPNPFRKVKGKVCQLQHPTPPLFVPVKAAVTPPTGQNRPFLGKDVKAEAVDSIQTTPVNPFSKAANGKVCQLQHPAPPPLVPVKAAVPPPADQNKNGVEAKAADGTQTTPVNPFSKTAKANGYIHHRPLPFVPVTTVLDGSKMANTYPANAFAHSVTPFPHIEQQGFLSRTFNKWFGY